MMRADEIYRFCESKKYGNLIKESKISATPTLQRLSLWQQGRCSSRERPNSASGVISTRTIKSTDDEIGRALDELHVLGAMARNHKRAVGAWQILQEHPRAAIAPEVNSFMNVVQRQLDGPRMDPGKLRIKRTQVNRATRLKGNPSSSLGKTDEKRQLVLSRMANNHIEDADRLKRLARRGEFRNKTKSRELRYGGVVKLRSKQKRWLWVCVLVLVQKSMVARLKHYRAIRRDSGLYVIKLQAYVRKRQAQRQRRKHQLLHTLSSFGERIGFHIRCWRRSVSGSIARKFIRGMFCKEGSSVGVDFMRSAKAFTYKMGFIQRRCRDVLVCRRARVHALTKYFDREEKKIVLQMRRERLEREQETLTQLAEAASAEAKGRGFASENLAWEAMRVEVASLDKITTELDRRVLEKNEQHGKWLLHRDKLHAFMDRKERENEALLAENVKDFEQINEAAGGSVADAWGNARGPPRAQKRRQAAGYQKKKLQQKKKKQQQRRTKSAATGGGKDASNGKEASTKHANKLTIGPNHIEAGTETGPSAPAVTPNSLVQFAFGFGGSSGGASLPSAAAASKAPRQKKLSLLSPSAMAQSTSSLMLTTQDEHGVSKRPDGKNGLRIVSEAMRTR
jgi:hypothetical protein